MTASWTYGELLADAARLAHLLSAEWAPKPAEWAPKPRRLGPNSTPTGP